MNFVDMIAAVLYFLYLASVCESFRFSTNLCIDRTSKHLPTFVRAKQIFSSESGNDEKEPSFIRQQLKIHFNKTMRKSNVPLLENFETFLNSLPVRKYDLGDYLRLCDYDYIVDPEDMKTMVNQIIEELPDYVRTAVRYISAPAGSGKTSSVLPAFLESTSMTRGGTHYLYLAFANNKKRTFTFVPGTPSNIEIEAEEQGAAFMVQCVKNLLERPDDIKAYEVTIPPTYELKTVSKYVKELKEYLFEKLGQDCRVWFHLDEHRKMCNRDSNPICGAAFSRGAMSVLAMVKNQIVIATYTDLPNLPPLGGSSEVCRKGIALPPLDVNQVTSGLVPELLINSDVNEEKDSTLKNRLLATLKVRLGFSIRQIDTIGILYKPISCDVVNNFLHNFQTAMNQKDRVKALKDCIALCKFSILESPESINGPKPDHNAAQLLIGVSDNDQSDWISKRSFSDILVLPNGLISLSVIKLLQLYDPGCPVYVTGRILFETYLTDPADEPDLLSSSPLKAAYYWTLSCRSASYGCIKFGKFEFNIVCKDLRPGRIFPDTDSSKYDLSFLEPSVMYYAHERDGLPTHPLGDLFFLTNKDELVLVDITRGSLNKAEQKQKKLQSWIKQEKDTISQYTLKGVVLAPNANGVSMTNDSVTMVCGKDAVKFLGGLSQIRRWMS